jgi:exodeoxyribonuclease VII large subunit
MAFVPPSIYTVSRLTAEIRDLLETGFDEIWVEGEISNLRIPPSGHCYFTLKDESSQIQAVIFRSQARFLRFEPEDGLSVICQGRISVYERKGQYQLVIDFMEPRGMGALQLAFDQLKRRLEAEGLFDPSRKKALPFLPKKIGIVTSPTGAVIRDMLTILKRRYENLAVTVYPVRVQGEGAPEEIARGITCLDERTDVDVIIVARGGGSLEDLWAFNEEIVARAIEKAKKPIISAVGHEVDFTICDFVADVRAPTPSAAAELVVRTKADLLVRIKGLRERLSNRMGMILKRRRDQWIREKVCLRDPRRRLVDLRLRGDDLVARLIGHGRRILKERRTTLENLRRNLWYTSPLSRTVGLRDSLVRETKDLETAMNDLVSRKRRSMERSVGLLKAMSPLNILRRGYSIVRKVPSMEIIRASGTVKKGDMTDVRLHQGRLICLVKEIKE